MCCEHRSVVGVCVCLHAFVCGCTRFNWIGGMIGIFKFFLYYLELRIKGMRQRKGQMIKVSVCTCKHLFSPLNLSNLS